MRRSGELHHHSFVRYRPVYVGTMRDPLRRLLSHYNYLHSGPRSLTTRLRHGPQAGEDAPSFEQCVRQAHMREPVYVGRNGGGGGGGGGGADASSSSSSSSSSGGKKKKKKQKKRGAPLSAAAASAMERKFRCLHWADVQLKYFCGYADFGACEAAAQDALDIAVRNVDRHFLVVGLVERFDESLKLLERLLPVVFDGIFDLYRQMGSSRVNIKSKGAKATPPLLSSTSTSSSSYSFSSSSSSSSSYSSRNAGWRWRLMNEGLTTSRAAAAAAAANRTSSSPLSPRVHAFVKDKLRYEQALYDHVARRFETQVKACHL